MPHEKRRKISNKIIKSINKKKHKNIIVKHNKMGNNNVVRYKLEIKRKK
jgi:hypothetical protein